jgi:hypothetical protein
MTAAAGAALSQMPWQLSWQLSWQLLLAVIRRRYFSNSSAAADFHPAAGNETGGLRLHRSRNLFRRKMHGCMSYPQERPRNPKPFITRITCSNLSVTEDDFIRQYF